MVTVRWWYRLATNAPDGWRQRLAQWLLAIAGKVDRECIPLVVRVECSPPLSRREKVECLEAGMDHASVLVEEYVRAAAVEAAMREAHPHLSVEDRHDGQQH